MLKKLRLKGHGASTIEYTMMIVVLLAAIIVMQKYILRGFVGRWKATGDTYGFGRQFNPKKTTECGYDMNINRWYLIPSVESCVAGCDATYGIGANLLCEGACPGLYPSPF